MNTRGWGADRTPPRVPELRVQYQEEREGTDRRKLSEENGIENDSVILSLGVWVHGNSLLR